MYRKLTRSRKGGDYRRSWPEEYNCEPPREERRDSRKDHAPDDSAELKPYRHKPD
jgi:hypothetical protein